MDKEQLAEQADPHKLVFTGTVKGLYKIFIVNLLLTIVTLGFFRFWAKVRTRKYLWSHTSLLDDPFEYTGKGRELLVGFLIVLVVFLIPFGVLGAWINARVLEGKTGEVMPIQIIQGIFIYYLIGVGTFAALRYRLTRTKWRGIRGGMEGSAIKYGVSFLRFAFEAYFTVGILYPRMQIKHLTQLYNRASFGSQKFEFDAPTKPLQKRWLALYGFSIALLVGLIAFAAFLTTTFKTAPLGAQVLFGATVIAFMVGIIWIQLRYQAFYLSHVYSHLSYGGFRFQYNVTGWQLLKLVLGNLLILVLTLGLGSPFITIRSVRFMTDNLSIYGEVDFDSVIQNQLAQPAYGEGLADAFDIGAI